jgi:hypothetical protein
MREVTWTKKGMLTGGAPEATEDERGARLNPGEKLNRRRMACVATVFDIEAHECSPEMIRGRCPDEDKPSRPRATNKRVRVSVQREPEDVIQDMFEEALRRDPERKRPRRGTC